MALGRRQVLILDDDRFLSSLLSTLLSEHGFICHVANDVSEAKKVLKATELDVALLDINLGEGPSGLQFATSVERAHPGVGIVFLTKTPDLVSLVGAPSSLPADYAVAGKEDLGDGGELLDAIESVLSAKRTPVRHRSPKAQLLTALTTHQREVLRDVAAGLTNRAIAESRGVTERSVERTLQAIFARLDIAQTSNTNPRVEAVRHYVEALGFPPR